jgi:hypothetical protein
MTMVRSPTTLSIAAFVFAILGWLIAVGGCGCASWINAYRRRSLLDIGVPVGEMLAIAVGTLLALVGLLLAAVALWGGGRSSILWTGIVLNALLAVPVVGFCFVACASGR